MKVKFTAERIMATGRMPNWLDESGDQRKRRGLPQAVESDLLRPGLSVATPDFTKAVTGFIAAGGKFVQNKDDKLQFPGAVIANYPFTSDGDPGHNAKGELISDYYWREWQLQSAPTFSSDLDKWLGPAPFRSNADENAMLMTVHQAGPATYVLMGNDYQDPNGARASSKTIPFRWTRQSTYPTTGGPILRPSQRRPW